MERLEYDQYGGPEVVHLRSFTLGQPKSHEIVVRVAAASINPLDWRIRSGKMKMVTGSKFPRAMGTDFAGIIEAIGSNVTRLKIGDAVVGTVPVKSSGAFAPKLITAQTLVVKKPENLSFVEAASLPLAGVTAWLALVKKGHLRRGQQLFINGAMGSVGQAALAIAKEVGAETTVRVGTHAIATAQSMGLSRVLDYNFPLPQSLQGVFDVVFDCNGSLSGRDAGRLRRSGGTIVDIVVTRPKFVKALTSWAHKIVFCNPEAKYLQPVIDLAKAGKLAIPIARSISLAEAPAHLALLEQGERLNGKVLVCFETR